MKHGFVKVAAITPKIKVADPVYNAKVICEEMDKAVQKGAKLLVFPELCLTGYTCQDLFLQETLLQAAEEALRLVMAHTEGTDVLVFVGFPFEMGQKLYNVAAVLFDGELLGMVPKMAPVDCAEFCESRYFATGNDEVTMCLFDEEEVPFGTNLLFTCDNVKGLTIGVEIGGDAWTPVSPGTMHALAGANVIVNLSACDEFVGKHDYRRMLVQTTSSRLMCGYITASAGEGESTQDLVFGGYNLIGENGMILAENTAFSGEAVYADLDIRRLCMERRKNNTFVINQEETYLEVPFTFALTQTQLERKFSPTPFVPEKEEDRARRCEEILAIQSQGLKKRYEHIGCKTAVLGISGGLDSTLALLVTVRAFDLLGLSREQIYAVTMPCFGTTDRTYQNARKLAQTLGTTLREVNIKDAVNIHFRDISHDPENHDVTYENAQARERTQVLMDIANQVGGLVIGTGDMSELALGWATYNGDHMSMYGVNAGVPKTLVRHLVRHYADTCKNAELAAVLLDVLDTPVSPELLPPKDGEISQVTEDLVGPYELHDYFLYYMLRMGYEPAKIYRIARLSFAGKYEDEVILKWLKNFYRRFFAQQFKRSCLPDGPKVGSVGLSPRGDLRMPSDACARVWINELEELS